MKKILLLFLFMFCGFAFATDYDTLTSKKYVDDEVIKLQNALTENTADTVMVYTDTPGTVDKKGIYDASSSYATQTDSLVTAATANTAIQNAIDSEFACYDPPQCTLFRIGPAAEQLPAGYTRLEYIVDTNATYINTSIQLSSLTDDVEATFRFTGESSYSLLFGARSTTTSMTYTFGIQSGAYDVGWNSVTRTYGTADSNKHTVRFYHATGVVTIDGGAIATLGAGSITTPISALLGGARNQHTTYNGSYELYGFRVWRNGELIANYIPASYSANGQTTVGMYDFVSETFKTSATSTAFTAGPVASFLPEGNSH